VALFPVSCGLRAGQAFVGILLLALSWTACVEAPNLHD
jgi:hypothetical protein